MYIPKALNHVHIEMDQIEITHEYKCLGIDFYSHDYFEPFNKRQRNTIIKALMGTLRKEVEVEVEVTCWELKSHLFKGFLLSTFKHGIEI